MKRLSLLLVFLFSLVLLPAATHAQGNQPDAPALTDPLWQARYWNSTTPLNGPPVLTRQEGDPNYVSTAGSFAPGVNADNFSARWEKYIDVQGGTYRFRVTADDGVRITVDNQLIIDKWFNQPATAYSADITLSAGYHYVVIDYYEAGGNAQLQFGWGPATSTPAPGPWSAQFWNNTGLSGNPAVTTTVNDVNFAWGLGAPITGINADGFSARFTRTVPFTSGNYRFHASTDDGMRVFVAGRPVIDQWRVQSLRTFSYDIFMPNGDAEVRVEYFDQSGGATARVWWERLGTAPVPTPAPNPNPLPGEVIVEDGSSGFRTGGLTTGFRTANEGSGGTLRWTKNNRTQQPNYNWARWYPTLAAGRYEVFAYIPERFSTTGNATYWVAHKDGFTSVRVNQSANGGRWVSLGTYAFRGTNADYASLNDITGETYLSRLIAFDAMKWVPR